jgi:hypothetical protein
MTKIIQTIFLIFVFTGFALAQVIGPGGVGNTSTLKLWLKADDLSLSNNGAQLQIGPMRLVIVTMHHKHSFESANFLYKCY